jgi:3-phytase
VTETDGIHVTTGNLGPLFPKGVFIAQDGLDDKGKQKFKFVPWQLIIPDDSTSAIVSVVQSHAV